jgi:hypothetical protein
MGSPNFAMSFTVTNRGQAAATALVFEITDRDFNDRPISEVSTYMLTGTFSPGPPIEIIKDDVPAPPHWHPLKSPSFNARSRTSPSRTARTGKVHIAARGLGYPRVKAPDCRCASLEW